HPLVRDLFPEMSTDAFEALVADIKENEQQEAVVIFEDAILDGWHRYQACKRLGIDPNFTVYSGDNPLAYAVSLNLRRRHLTDDERTVVAAKLATRRRGDNQHSPIGGTSQAEAAELLNVSKRGVERVSGVLNHGTPELVKAIESGEVSVSAAAEVASLPEDEQREVLAGGDKAVAAKAKELREERAAETAAARKWDVTDNDRAEPEPEVEEVEESEPKETYAEYEARIKAEREARAKGPADWRYWSRVLPNGYAKRIKKTCLDKECEVSALYSLEREEADKLIAAAERGE